jgi:hypothetical protein
VNANNAGIGTCSTHFFVTGTAAGSTQPCSQPALADLADGSSVVTMNGSQTLANKTIASPLLTGTPQLNGHSLTYAATPAISGDCAIDPATGISSCSKLGGVAPGSMLPLSQRTFCRRMTYASIDESPAMDSAIVDGSGAGGVAGATLKIPFSKPAP